MIRIVIVDGHKLFRVSLKSLIDSFSDCEVVLNVDSLSAIPRDYDTKGIHLVIFDPDSPKEKKADSYNKVRDKFLASRIMILSHDCERENIIRYMELGVSGYFSKEDCPSKLQRTIMDIAQSYDFSEVRLGPIVRQNLIDDFGLRQKKRVEFTDREIQVLRLVCMEKTNAEISDILGLSIRTIESHRRRMIDKVDCRSIIGVILNALDLKTLNLSLKPQNGFRASG